jgi:hypothetical protein
MSPHARETRPFASEIKFVIPAARGGQIRDSSRQNLEPDPYGGGQFNDRYHTASLYFDTADGRIKAFADTRLVYLSKATPAK